MQITPLFVVNRPNKSYEFMNHYTHSVKSFSVDRLLFKYVQYPLKKWWILIHNATTNVQINLEVDFFISTS